MRGGLIPLVTLALARPAGAPGDAPPAASSLQSTVRYFTPRWSPDGRSLMFGANLDQPRRVDLHTIAVDGSGLKPLRQDARDGSWSPDGGRIVFSVMKDGHLDVWVMDAKTGEAKQLTATPEMDYGPVWSPDGTRLAFVSIPAGPGQRHDVHLMSADGQGRRAVAQTPSEEMSPSWTPDARLVFASNRDGNWELYSMRPDGQDVKRLTEDPAADTGPAVSPDGKVVAFSSNRGGSPGIWRVNIDGTEPTRLGSMAGSMLAWSPDGRSLAYVGQADGTPGVFVMNADGTGARRVTPIPVPRVVVNRLARLAWLGGCWERRSAQRVTVEMWMPPDGNLMLGASRTVADGITVEYEQLRIHAAGDTVVYTALPSGQREASFRSTQVSDSGFTVENPAHDFPQRIIYRRRGADSLVARIEGPSPSGTRGIDFPMRRVGCTVP